MKRFFFFFSLLVICAVNLHAQGEFRLNMRPKQKYTHSNNPEISCLLVEVHGIDAELEIEADALVIEKRDTFSTKGRIQYWYEIKVSSKWKQEVKFMIDGYHALSQIVSFDGPKELQPIIITDPNNATSGYDLYRKNARKYFEKGDYERAMVELKTAATQSDVRKDELEGLISEIDSIQGLYAAAQDSADLKKYYAAKEIYEQIKYLNEGDKAVNKMISEMQKKYEDYTAILSKDAENYNLQRNYDKAIEYYQKYIDARGVNKELANSKIVEIKRIKQEKRAMPHVFYYQFDSNAPIGFGYGRFNDRKVGWFMNFSMNSEVFNLIQQKWVPKDGESTPIPVYECKEVNGNKNYNLVPPADVIKKTKNVPEVNLAIVGLSIPLVSPHPERDNQYFKLGKLVIPKFPALYLNIVPLSASLAFGYNETILYRTDDTDVNAKPVKLTTQDQINEFYDKKKSGYSYDSECRTTALFNYAPQVGLTLKWGRLALFYTYEYRYLVNERTRYKDGIRANRNMFGLGFAW